MANELNVDRDERVAADTLDQLDYLGDVPDHLLIPRTKAQRTRHLATATPYRTDAELRATASRLADIAGDDPWSTGYGTSPQFNPNPR